MAHGFEAVVAATGNGSHMDTQLHASREQLGLSKTSSVSYT